MGGLSVGSIMREGVLLSVTLVFCYTTKQLLCWHIPNSYLTINLPLQQFLRYGLPISSTTSQKKKLLIQYINMAEFMAIFMKGTGRKVS